MRKLIIASSIPLLIAGCVNTEQKQAQAAEFRATIPECHSEQQCELMWSAARRWVLSNAGYKFQHITPDFMETYNPTESSLKLAARVVKEPLPDGSGYNIVISTWCANIFGCAPDAHLAAINFNKQVSAAGATAFPDAANTTKRLADNTTDTTAKKHQYGRSTFAAEKLAKEWSCTEFKALSIHATEEMYSAVCADKTRIINCDLTDCRFLQ